MLDEPRHLMPFWQTKDLADQSPLADDLYLHQATTLLRRCCGILLPVLTIGLVGLSLASAQPAAQPTVADELALNQGELADRFSRLEKLILRMAEFDQGTNPRRAETLKEAYSHAKQQQIRIQLEAVMRLLNQDQYRRAIGNQEMVINDLRQLLKVLEAENRGDRLKDDQARVREYIKEVERLQRMQRSVRGRTEGGIDEQQAAREQDQVAERTGALGERIQQNEGLNENDDSETSPGDSDTDDSNADQDSDDDPAEDTTAPEKDTPHDRQEGTGPDESGSDSASESEPRGGAPKSGEGQAGEPESGEPREGGEQGESQPSENAGKPGEQPDGQSQPGESGQGQGESGEGQEGQRQDGQSQGGQGQSGEGDSSQTPPSEQFPGQQKIQQAQQQMQRAKQALDEAKRDEAVERQKEAAKKLAEAKAQLEEILRQLREEEIERTLAQLESRFQKMLEMQLRVNERTVQLADFSADDRILDIEASKLSFQEKRIVVEADKALTLLREEGSSVAFPETVDQMRDDMQQVVDRLARARVGMITQGLEDDIVQSLEEMIEALQMAQQEQEERKANQQMGQQMGTPGDMPLVNAIAELKMIKALQLRVNKRTGRYAQMLDDIEDPAGQATDEELIEALQGLSQRELRVQEITHDIAIGKNK